MYDGGHLKTPVRTFEMTLRRTRMRLRQRRRIDDQTVFFMAFCYYHRIRKPTPNTREASDRQYERQMLSGLTPDCIYTTARAPKIILREWFSKEPFA